jgi:hypothetical protein
MMFIDIGEYTDAVRLGIAAGLFGAAVTAAAGWLQTPAWTRAPDVGPLGSVVPFVQIAMSPFAALMMRVAVLVTILVAIDRMSSGFTRYRPLAVLAVAVIGFLGAGAPSGLHLGGWLAAALVTSAGLVVVYFTLLRADLTMLPMALGVMIAAGTLSRGLQRPFPGALLAAIVAALLAVAFGWLWFHILRRSAT